MERHITEILNENDARELQQEFDDLISSGANYDDVEELMLDYGLEMDYIFDLL